MAAERMLVSLPVLNCRMSPGGCTPGPLHAPQELIIACAHALLKGAAAAAAASRALSTTAVAARVSSPRRADMSPRAAATEAGVAQVDASKLRDAVANTTAPITDMRSTLITQATSMGRLQRERPASQ
mmetsp:Transcript_13574/g.36329  ORF Transcript_13574/g.36329 Transcript_13574/m.36329 type:complete len:128 (-) Transcript_13574:10-393(-)